MIISTVVTNLISDMNGRGEEVSEFQGCESACVILGTLNLLWGNEATSASVGCCSQNKEVSSEQRTNCLSSLGWSVVKKINRCRKGWLKLNSSGSMGVIRECLGHIVELSGKG